MTDNKKTTDGTAEGQINLQDPEMSLKPEVSVDLVPALINKLYGLKPRDVKELPSYNDRNYFFNADVDGTNDHHSSSRADGYVMKILNTVRSSQPAVVEANLAFQQYLRDRGISTQVPVPNKDGKEFSLERVTVGENDLCVEKGQYIVWVVTFLPGDTFFNTPYVPGSFYNIGKFIGRFHQAAKGFHHPFYDTHKHIWSLTEVPALSDFLHAVKNPGNLAVVKEVMAAFETEVKPKFSTFTEGVIHGDFNEQNIVMAEDPGQDETPRDSRIHDVSGILDFAHVTSSFNVLDLTVSIAYLSIECPDEGQTEVGGHVLAGVLTDPEAERRRNAVLKDSSLLSPLSVVGVWRPYLLPATLEHIRVNDVCKGLAPSTQTLEDRKRRFSQELEIHYGPILDKMSDEPEPLLYVFANKI